MNSSGAVRRAASIARDVRALGIGAPVRAALELSKRAGGHDLVFHRLARTAITPHTTAVAAQLQLPRSARPVDPVPPAARARTLERAAEIAAGTVELFGQRIEVGAEPDWHATIDGPDRWPAEPWWQLDIRSDVRTGDVKWVWELGRHHHLVVLARAAHLEPENPEWPTALSRQLETWLDANPPEIGIHWYSNLEIALRAIAWIQILGLAGDALGADLRTRMAVVLHHSGRHLLADLPYTLSTMRNNHLVGDALGLTLIGRLFPADRAAQRWIRIGDRVLDRQLPVQLRDDGSMIEDSLSYHRFVLEMLIARSLFGRRGRATDMDDLVSSAQFLARFGVLDGEVPRYGDGDEGRVLTSTGAVTDHAGSVRAALALAGAGATAEDRARYDECAWYAREGLPLAPDPTERDGRDVGAGIARAERGTTTIWLKGGGGPSHGHGDLCSTPIAMDGAWVIEDPGTGTYNGPLVQRDWFRTSIAHDVVRVDGIDQLEPHRAFRWRHPADASTGGIGPPLTVPGSGTGAGGGERNDDGERRQAHEHEGGLVVWAWHRCYERLEPPRRVVRAVVLPADGVTVTVVDWIEPAASTHQPTYAMSWPLAATAVVDDLDGAHVALRLSTTTPDHVHLHLPGVPTVHTATESPFDAWSSPTYGSIVASTRLEVTGTASEPIVWSVGRTVDDPRAIARRLRVRWTPSAIELEVTGRDGEQVSSAVAPARPTQL